VTNTNNANDEPYSIYKIMQYKNLTRHILAWEKYKEGIYKNKEKQPLRIINHIYAGVIDTVVV
jgi:hypothetical protein